MWRRMFLVLVGVILVITIMFGVRINVVAQGDYKSISRVQEDQWCTNRGYVGVTAKDESPQTVNSFPYCKGNDGNLYKVDMVQLCRDLYGNAYANPQYWDYTNYDSWYCNHINNANPPPANNPPQNNGGNSGSSSDAKYPDAQEPSGPGIRVPIICQHWYGLGSSGAVNNAWQWHCDNGVAVDFQQACRDAWGSALPYATLTDWKDKYGWRCSSQPGYVDPYPGQGSSENSGQQTQNSGCSLAPASYLSVGNMIQVTTDEVNLRSTASLSGTILAKMYTGAQATVTGNPSCADGYRWWQMSYQGTSGWAVDGDTSEGAYWAGSGGSASESNSGAGISIPITLPYGGSFSLQVIFDGNSCIIQNGAELTITEIQNLQAQLNGKSKEDKVAMVIAYLQPGSGIVEQIRHNVENAIGGLAQSCNPNKARYQIGNQLMDLSGPGNIVFGYVMGAWGWPLFVEDQMANGDQMIRDFASRLHWGDEPDDICQREVGRALTAGGRVDAVNAGLLANEIGRSCSFN